MSTLKVNKIENTATTNGGIAIDNTGHVQVDGLQMPTAGPLSNRNMVVNGAMQVYQKGAITSTDGWGGPDRYFGMMSATSYIAARTREFDAPAGSGLHYCYQWKTTTARTGSTADQYIGPGTRIEFQDIYNAVWGGSNTHVTVSFWVKSSLTGTYAFNFNACNTDSGLAGDRVLYHATYTINVANTWEKKTITIPLSGLSTHSVLSTDDAALAAAGVELTWPLGISSGGGRSTASVGWNTTEARNGVSSSSSDTGFFSTVNATFKLTGVQFEAGSKATPFEHRSYGDELLRCQRYYYKADITNAGSRFGNGYAYDSNSFELDVLLPVRMRAKPTAVETSGTNGDYTAHMGNAGVKTANSQPTMINSNNRRVTVRCDFPSSSFSTGAGGSFRANNTNAFLGFDARI